MQMGRDTTRPAAGQLAFLLAAIGKAAFAASTIGGKTGIDCAGIPAAKSDIRFLCMLAVTAVDHRVVIRTKREMLQVHDLPRNLYPRGGGRASAW